MPLYTSISIDWLKKISKEKCLPGVAKVFRNPWGNHIMLPQYV